MNTAIKPDQIGHVIRILDEYNLIIDTGHGLSVGDVIQVYSVDDVLNDLDGNPLCYFVNVKDELEVVDVQDHYSLCRKNKKIEHTVPLFYLQCWIANISNVFL